jgi:ankyrin repeat protein
MYSPLTRARLRIASVVTFASTAINALLAQATPRVSSELHRVLNRTVDHWRTLLATAAVDVRDAQGNTHLLIAALREYASAVDALLNRGADANAVNLA